MKYEKEFDEIMDCMIEDWMSEEDVKVFKDEVLRYVVEDTFDEDIQAGIENGYPVTFQIDLFKKELKKIFKNGN